jgi:glycosyltransferase involved in cell wall biosynthesis
LAPPGRGQGAIARPAVVAMVSDAIYPYHIGGKEVRYHHIAEGLAKEGVEVHVFTMHWWTGPRHRVEDGVHYHGLCRRYRLYRRKRRSVLEAVMFSVACFGLLRHRFDLIEADEVPHLQLFTLRLVAWLRRVPLVVTWHEVWGPAYWRSYLGPAGVVAAVIEQLTMRLADAIVVYSPGSLNRLLERGVPSRKVSLVPNGVDVEAIARALPSPKSFDLLYAGRLIEHKHVDLLLDALALLVREGLAVTCGIVGDGPERSRLVHQASRLSLTERVQFLGNLEQQSEVFSLMKAARVFALPSTREGFGMVVAEAIASGLIVVTVDHPDNQAACLVEEGVTGFRCEPTAASLGAALREALEHPGIAAEARRRLEERFSWQACVGSVLDTYRRVLVSGP